MTFQLRPGETVLFEGDVTLLKSKLSVVETDAMVTDQRLMVVEGKQGHEKADIAAVTEEKHGFTNKMVFTLRSGGAIALTAANHAGFKAAAMILTGQAAMGSMPKEPELAKVRNGTAWLAAFGPIIAGAVVLVLLALFWGGDLDRLRFINDVQLFAARVATIYVLLRIDYLSLQRQGFNVQRLGIADPITFPVYLFSRAKAFGHSKAYAITWCALVGIDILLALG